MIQNTGAEGISCGQAISNRHSSDFRRFWAKIGHFSVLNNGRSLSYKERWPLIAGIETPNTLGLSASRHAALLVAQRLLPKNDRFRRILYVGTGAFSGVAGSRLQAGPCHGWKPVRVSAVRPRVSLALQPFFHTRTVARARARISKEGVRR
jgi:hypothetical protein